MKKAAQFFRDIYDKLYGFIKDEPILYIPFALAFLISVWLVVSNNIKDPTASLIDGLLITFLFPVFGFIWYARRNAHNPLVHPVIHWFGIAFSLLWILTIALRFFAYSV